MANASYTLEERIEELEERIDELESEDRPTINIHWDAVAIVGVWIGVAIICFAPAAQGKIEEIVGGGVIATIAIALIL